MPIWQWGGGVGAGSLRGMYNYLHHCISRWKQRKQGEKREGRYCNVLKPSWGEKCCVTRKVGQSEVKAVYILLLHGIFCAVLKCMPMYV